jgi:hypothetical protein
MVGQHKTDQQSCPDATSTMAETQARQAFEGLLALCRQDNGAFRRFETNLLQRLFALACLLVRLFLTIRHERFLWQDPTPPRGYRRGNPQAPRTLKTVFGPVI